MNWRRSALGIAKKGLTNAGVIRTVKFGDSAAGADDNSRNIILKLIDVQWFKGWSLPAQSHGRAVTMSYVADKVIASALISLAKPQY